MKVTYIQIFFSFFIMMNPLLMTSFFLSVSEGFTDKEKKQIANTCLFATVIILILCVFIGTEILYLFGITINDLSIAGGILFTVIGISMVMGKGTDIKYTKDEHKEAIAKEASTSLGVVPLAIPLTAGPGTILFAIVYAGQCTTAINKAYLLGIIIVMALLVWLCMLAASSISKVMGKTGLSVLTRLMGLILLSIGMHILVSGIRGSFFPHI